MYICDCKFYLLIEARYDKRSMFMWVWVFCPFSVECSSLRTQWLYNVWWYNCQKIFKLYKLTTIKSNNIVLFAYNTTEIHFLCTNRHIPIHSISFGWNCLVLVSLSSSVAVLFSVLFLFVSVFDDDLRVNLLHSTASIIQHKHT